MGKVIAIAHQKGGVGKSTIALNLAVEFSKRLSLKVVDLDYQKSLSIFNEHRKEKALEPLDILEAKDPKELMRIIDETSEHILIDSGGFDSNLNRIALLGADLIITPVSNNLIEIYGLEAFKNILEELKNIKADIKAHVLLNNVNPTSSKAIEEMRHYIQKSDYFDMFQSVLRRRVLFSRSFESGQSVIEMDDKSKAAKELSDLIGNIESILFNY
ncbi:chromosome partitioning protein (plasmid) [Nitratiruptor sp. YY08-26]|uniref:ParA family protein n=1 Tax=unclassified Nitratiruptor TaxID=2624044 RepID=UPI0018EE25BB|nr:MULTISPECIES: ParA family protein [unclassified Nitratiruptor]BCD63173.1 chromosome partitioning protein [Nitratiruptor sp. YY08-13]BCD67109.1 chromosome partitioning protein [Nitratiruptor sp. YY08-26]